MEFTKVDPVEAQKLRKALRDNAERGTPLNMDPLTTGWTPDAYDNPEDSEVIAAIQSVPCHY